MTIASRSTGRSSRTARLALPLAVLVAGVAAAGPGDLDPDFGTAGRVFFSETNVFEAATAIAQQQDGKLLVGRWVYYYPSTEDLSVIRYLPDGRLDPGFDGDGRTGVDLGGIEGSTRAVIQLRDGRIIAAGRIAGYEDDSSSQIGIVRYAATGAVDRTFGHSGVVTGSFGAAHASIEAVVEQPDRRLIGAGFVGTAGEPRQYDMLIVRLEANGSPDPSFGVAGKLIVDFSTATTDAWINAVALQPDGKAVAAGVAYDAAGTQQLAVLRVAADGQPDPTFGMNGRITIALDDQAPPVQVALQLQGDGRILLAAQDYDDSEQACVGFVARLNADGSPDLAFGQSGFANLPLGPCGYSASSALAVEPGGAIVFANTARASLSSDVLVARLTPAGSLDGTFGVNGTTTVVIASDQVAWSVDPSVGVAMVLQSDGAIALSASDQFDWEGGGDAFMVARLRANGDSPGLIGFLDYFTSVVEDAGSATLRVRRTGGASGAVSANYAMAGQSTGGLPNHINASGTLSWADGDASEKSIVIATVDDAIYEGDEWLGIELAISAGGAQLAFKRAALLISDNEPAPPSPPAPAPTPGSPGYGGGGALGALLALALVAALGRKKPVAKSGS
jgi:uncharacterized delta-60 repeat protein